MHGADAWRAGCNCCDWQRLIGSIGSTGRAAVAVGTGRDTAASITVSRDSVTMLLVLLVLLVWSVYVEALDKAWVLAVHR